MQIKKTACAIRELSWERYCSYIDGSLVNKPVFILTVITGNFTASDIPSIFIAKRKNKSDAGEKLVDVLESLSGHTINDRVIQTGENSYEYEKYHWELEKAVEINEHDMEVVQRLLSFPIYPS
ncbi:hypothetical protein [Xenorhabdus bovienii]|uniref:hypothetical protein n=2 Tax=Xenorhabdus bovienii TaxID=40576 RepID=UPI0023B23BA5|nr:hypothetical protein [Xenorhabdus bovienii]MDE9454633.1 hypothetical protein [Xenorhabdus bovienii]MDE9494378.1 hypothetical protein [Xenorhabdus bovienii]MDE9502817.1 hypothetical protein [Xenorhabdus bovienii]MDE9526432.1 hypothetical protein [Xenorhabdus bovienii]MDE9568777.1 hypothetical protein [Xenorhabdus bovienii]